MASSNTGEVRGGVSQLRSDTLNSMSAPTARNTAAPRVIASNVDLATFRKILIDELVGQILEKPLAPLITLVEQTAAKLAAATGQPLEEAKDVIEAELRKRPELTERFRRG